MTTAEVKEEMSSTTRKSQKAIPLTAGLIMGVIMINIFQTVPAKIFKVLYPLLYGNAGYSEDNLSMLRFGSIPSCLKFLAGYFFQAVWIAPRWLAALMNVLSGLAIFITSFVPLNAVGWNAFIFFLVYSLRTVSDVVTDGHMLHIFQDSGAVWSVIQMFSGYIFDVVIAYMGTVYFDSSMFIWIGLIIFLGTPCYWLFPWDNLPKMKFGPIMKSIWDTRWMLIITFFYGFVSEWGASMLSYFINDIVDETAKMGAIFSLYKVAIMLGLMFGQFLFIKAPYRIGILGAISLEILGVLCFIFLSSRTPVGVISVLFLVGGLLTSLSDAVPRTMQIDASNLTQSATFLYAWFLSVMNVAEVVSGIVAPQTRETVSWPAFWGICLGINGGILLILGLLFFLVPDARKDHSLKMKPTVDYEVLKLLFCGKCFKGRTETLVDVEAGSRLQEDADGEVEMQIAGTAEPRANPDLEPGTTPKPGIVEIKAEVEGGEELEEELEGD